MTIKFMKILLFSLSFISRLRVNIGLNAFYQKPVVIKTLSNENIIKCPSSR